MQLKEIGEEDSFSLMDTTPDTTTIYKKNSKGETLYNKDGSPIIQMRNQVSLKKELKRLKNLLILWQV